MWVVLHKGFIAMSFSMHLCLTGKWAMLFFFAGYRNRELTA